NNRIYGLTKGQYSPTSEVGKITKSTPMGSLDAPFNPVSLAIGAEASFVARTIDSDRKHLTEVLRQAAAHPGTALVEIYQNCNIFNDGAFDALKDPDTRDTSLLRLEQGAPYRLTPDGEETVHDPHDPDPTRAFALSRMNHPTPIGVFRSVERPVYDVQMTDQLDLAVEQHGKGDLAALLAGGDTWTVVPERSSR
ncbi:thiamine pyrophosphate-dependent enzyme, partial [Streptomyces sp. NPDC049590]